MKTDLPDSLKADLPPTLWGKVLGATPVVMTVIATMLAGLASSEMTKAQYDRSLAAQQQSKAGDQWSFFQAKRMRSALQHNTLDLLQAANPLHPLDTATLRSAAAAAGPQGAAATTLLASETGQHSLAHLLKGEPPPVPAATPIAPEVQAALTAIEGMRPEPEIAALIARIDDPTLGSALLAAKARSDAFDTLTRPVNQLIEALNAPLSAQHDGGTLNRDYIAARLTFAAARYDAEARLNQVIASLYELQVRKNNLSAERHHARSQRFFYGMLGAQMAVIISTFAVAARKRNLLWSLAAAAGVAALLFATYVFLFI
ncbi:MAG: DUF4337 family protein [Opitutaceae bacterium]|nr:DUF4337 family protein [Opitutaceae bacterium]